MKKWVVFLLLTTNCWGQTPTPTARDLILRGDAAAYKDDHEVAIGSYEEAIQVDGSLRPVLLLKLGQQYLWANKASRAADLLGEYVASHPQDCVAKSTFALALSWSDQLARAARAYQEIREQCGDLRNDALLGEARTARWREHYRDASELYQQVSRDGTEAQKRDAALGQALVKLALDDNRAAREDFRALVAHSNPDPAAFEGLAVSNLHLGMPDVAQRDIDSSGMQSPALQGLSEHIHEITAPAVSSSTLVFHDGDGTNYVSEEVLFGFAPLKRGRVAALGGGSRLDDASNTIQGRWGAGVVDQRFDESLALHGEVRYTDYRGLNFAPVTGEVDAVITPSDPTRIDLSLARITIWDNVQALQNHLLGTFVSGGIDQRITPYDRITAAISYTNWSDNNYRMIYRLIPAHTFQGRPRITLAVPMLYESYNQGFQFGLFSPTSYIEVTPAVDVVFRKARIWSFNLGGRLGTQKEEALPWKLMGSAYFQVQRDLAKGWALQATAGYSSSNLASSSGFSRTRVFFSIVRSF